ncbi:MAG: hypothetical protein H3C51_03405 [Rubellimicrobium sp.]|nr:hypothetical protein [Rubellimicrobium sp.]
MAVTWKLASRTTEADVQSLAAMIGPVRFRLGDRWVEPLAVAPWGDDTGPEFDALPGTIRRLRGEWPCAPFGSDADRPELPDDWQPQDASPLTVTDPDLHGFCANNDWELVERADESIVLAIEPPEDHALARIEREIRLSHDRAGVEFRLVLHPRRDCLLPLGLHPVLPLGADPDSVILHLAHGARAWTYPVDTEPGRSIIAVDQRDIDPAQVALRDGRHIDIRRLPLPSQSEDLVLLTGLGGRIGCELPRMGCRLDLTWQEEHLPSCQLWVSGQGRLFYPWSGRFRGLGVEPVAAPFDLGPAIAAGANPLNRAGTATAVRLTAGVAFSTRYAMDCSAL